MKPKPLPTLAMAALLLGAQSHAVAHETEYDVAYVQTPPKAVEMMLDMAGVGPQDFVIDLGTGDGRIAIAAAKRGARALGVEIDPHLVIEARNNSVSQGVADRVSIVEQDLFDTDLKAATVVTLFLNQDVNLRLRPSLLEQLDPGTRVVSHNFDMADWRADLHQPFIRVQDGNYLMHDLFLWVIPGDADGRWSGTAGGVELDMTLEQSFQLIDASVTLANRPLSVEAAQIAGEQLRIDATDPQSGASYRFDGLVTAGAIAGTLTQVTFAGSLSLDWRVEEVANVR